MLTMCLICRKVPDHSRFRGKQLTVTSPKRGSAPDALFADEVQTLRGPYSDVEPPRYLVTQPRKERKMGFGSGDARKRDAIMNTMVAQIMTDSIRKVRCPTQRKSVEGGILFVFETLRGVSGRAGFFTCSLPLSLAGDKVAESGEPSGATGQGVGIIHGAARICEIQVLV